MFWKKNGWYEIANKTTYCDYKAFKIIPRIKSIQPEKESPKTIKRRRLAKRTRILIRNDLYSIIESFFNNGIVAICKTEFRKNYSNNKWITMK